MSAVNNTATTRVQYKKRSQTKEIWRRFRKNKSSIIGMIIIAILIICAIFAENIAPYDPVKQDYAHTLEHPSKEHIFGTDEFGRDIFSRIIFGARTSLSVGLISVSISCIVGGVIGAISGYFGGRIDTFIMRCMDVFLAIPSILFNISIIAALGPGIVNMMIAVGVSNIPRYCRIMRASVLQIKNQEFIEAAKAGGALDFFIITFHVVPNSLAPIIVQATLNVGSAIIACAGLSFIGVGISPPTPEWGAMLSNGRDLLRNYSYITAFPGLAIMITVLSLNLMGDGLRDAFDPKLKR
ncbi:ABC transporter permease [Sedimentibacter hydroxybenzoicus DSM 7310]|uniref:ABC transporter permease n=1 Tax=Sedimentibacter hydroxybenzoicus DSM 7310 TaxID=1123245 RepID=A0A974BM05_SEDHY|nr:ABC transporter permease [Sedimentibacter hydroxybenzoicus]NYB75286.1 ABC transporter permease [Sedimentibacter hydroxybenzoicus DSM 7310]